MKGIIIGVISLFIASPFLCPSLEKKMETAALEKIVRVPQSTGITLTPFGKDRQHLVVNGYLIQGRQLKALPIGSTMDSSTGLFHWSPGPAFIGEYRFRFISRRLKREVLYRVIINSEAPLNASVFLRQSETSASGNPFGYMDTPIDGSTVQSSIPVTGWALDNTAGLQVKIYRDPVDGETTSANGYVFLGDGIFISGARSDIESLYPGYANSSSAGWGFMLLTNFLPNSGNGSYVIRAIATDASNNSMILGSKTIHCDNQSAINPFGAIDTPVQGGTASGDSFINFGWALTPMPNSIPTDGSTLSVLIDGKVVGNPVYNNYRSDIASLFPGYVNSNNAVGYFSIDTTAYANGLHSIEWIAIDSDGNAGGIGSRYFWIDNGTGTLSYPIVSTNQDSFYNNLTEISVPSEGSSFHGQDAQYKRNEIQYRNNGNGTINDLVTGLTWSQSPDLNGDGRIDADDKLLYDDAVSRASSLVLGGYSDWRLPTIKELYSLIIFSGKDPSGYIGTDTSGLVPFIDTTYFAFGYGDTSSGERIIDAQFASLTKYVGTTNGMETMFGVNFADGRIKGYGFSAHNEKAFYVLFVRGNDNYGKNNFVDNGDGTISDQATGLMWMQNDNGSAVTWQDALSHAENMIYAGYSDWRLPDIKELQSIVDYTRSPATSGSPAIDPLFNCTQITNEGGIIDYPFYWSGTTHTNYTSHPGRSAAYISFGRAMGYMGTWTDVHGAGAQRSDPKTGDPDDYPYGHGPQGDAIRIYNYARLVRTLD